MQYVWGLDGKYYERMIKSILESYTGTYIKARFRYAYLRCHTHRTQCIFKGQNYGVVGSRYSVCLQVNVHCDGLNVDI